MDFQFSYLYVFVIFKSKYCQLSMEEVLKDVKDLTPINTGIIEVKETAEHQIHTNAGQKENKFDFLRK